MIRDTKWINLGPGELLFTKKPEHIWMILGSCVAISFFDKQSGYAAICHAQLTHMSRKIDDNQLNSSSNCIDVTPGKHSRVKYVECAVKSMIGQFNRAGIENSSLVAGVYGGSNLMHYVTEKSVGEQNSEAAFFLCKEYGIPVVEHDIGGDKGRTIIFNTKTGEVTVEMQKPGLFLSKKKA